MSYSWDFFTVRSSTPGEALRDCHRGPMIDVELRMSQPFTLMKDLEVHRGVLLKILVNSLMSAVKTRECILRVINSELGPIVPYVYQNKDILQALVCEKRKSTDIENALEPFTLDFKAASKKLLNYNFPKESEALIQTALDSNSPISRVAGRCAIILVATLIEMGV